MITIDVYVDFYKDLKNNMYSLIIQLFIYTQNN